MRSISVCCLTLGLVLLARGADAETVFPGGEWEVAIPQSQAVSTRGLKKVELWLKSHGSKTGLVIRRGRIVGEWYFGETKADTRVLVYSTTKSVASTGVGLAIDAGKLRLDTKVGDLFPAATPPEKREITVRQLLSMTSGIKSEEPVPVGANLFPYALHELPVDNPPGTNWAYNNAALLLLLAMVHEATGEGIDELLDGGIFQKIGIRREDWTWGEPGGLALASSGLHITGRALARFGLLILNKGNWNGQQLVSADWVSEAPRTSQDLNKAYGYLWWNNSTGAWPGVPEDAFAALGRHDNDMLIVPSLDLIVIRQVGDDSAANRTLRIAELFKLAVDACTDR